MFWIGCHLSAAKGYLAMGKTAKRIGANTFQFFTRNPRGGSVKALDLEDIAAYRAFAKENGFGKILAHAPYTLNACAADARVLAFARQVMQEDLERLAHLPEAMYNFHPGSHVKQGEEIGIVKIADMAGKGTEVGRTFEQLAAILARVERKEQMGVCLDTCHVFDGGYDIVSDWEGVLRQFDEIIGLESLCAVHLNDSKNPLGSRKDRHACLGEGTIGHMAIAEVICHPKLRDVPFLLETPNELEGYAREIAWLRTIRKGE